MHKQIYLSIHEVWWGAAKGAEWKDRDLMPPGQLRMSKGILSAYVEVVWVVWSSHVD